MAQHGAQLVCLHAAVAVFMHQKLRLTSARLWPRKLAGRRPAEHQHGRRHNVFRQVQQGAVLVADQKVTDVDYRIDASQIGPDGLMLRKGKKNYCRLILK